MQLQVHLLAHLIRLLSILLFFFFFFCFFFGKAQAVTRRLCSGICLFLLMLFARAYATFRRFCLNFAFFFVGKYAFSNQLVQLHTAVPDLVHILWSLPKHLLCRLQWPSLLVTRIFNFAAFTAVVYECVCMPRPSYLVYFTCCV